MRKKCRIKYLLLVLVLVLATLNPWQVGNQSKAATVGVIREGAVNVNFRETPNGTIHKDANGNNIRLNAGHELTILDTSNSAWYKVSLTYNGTSYTGYVSSQYITITGTTQEELPAQTAAANDFEAYLTAQGFPESYKVMLRKLHEKYPNWEFQAIQTGIDWNTLVSNEVNKQGQVKNLVWTSSSTPHYNWRSTVVGYNWATDTWSPYDGTVWFAASDALVTYYLDPRTYLYENYIFLFESLSYQKGMQNETGVEAILKGTFMYQTKPAGEDKTYAQIIMQAAEESGVSPYHIASRIRQEMGTTAGQAALGTNSKYPGIYNYFNIGATDTANGSAVEKGLQWAATSGGSYGRPWDTVSKAIIGGSKYLGASYISVGQDTLYTQKFNVTNKNSLFSHQYMTNVQAPSTECLTSYNAYKANNLLDSTMVFKIPVYTNMPASPVTKPADSGNPNNWLKLLSVHGYNLTPTFAANTTNNYSLIVPESVSSISVSATAVNANAKIAGTGTLNLAKGTNNFNIVVTAQNGSTRTYTLTVVRGTATSGGSTGGNVSSGMRGDLNGDGKITALDIVKVQRLIVGLDPITDTSLALGDVNKDGKISALDIVKIQRHIVGLETITN